MTLETMDIDPKRKRYIIDTLNPVLEEAVGALIAAEPGEPAEYLMAQFLAKLGGDVPALPDDPPEIQKNRELKATLAALKEDVVKAVTVNVQLGKTEEAKDDEEEEEEDEDDDIPEPEPITRTGNRTSVSAEAYGAWNQKAPAAGVGAFVAPVYEKTDEQVARIREILAKSWIFANVEEKQLDVIYKAMNKVEYKAEDVVLSEGDEGDYLFIVDDGKLVCYKEKEGEANVLKTCVGGDIFGELSLLYNAPRAASVKAKAPSLLWKLDRDTFKNIHSAATERARKQAALFLAKVHVLTSFTQVELTNLADVLVAMKFGPDEEVIKQGEDGDTFYIVEEGTLVVMKDGAEAMRYGPGDYFGELALLSKSSGKRQATVKTHTAARLLTLKRDAFKRMFGNLESMLLQNAKTTYT